MLQIAERPSVSGAEPSKEIVKSFPANDSFNNSFSPISLQVARLRRRFLLSEHLATAVAHLDYPGRTA